jgi:hypothetical protein
MSLNNTARRLLPSGLRRTYRNLKLILGYDAEFMLKRLDYLDRSFRGLARHGLNREYPGLIQASEPKSEINRHEFKIYSQYGEDGILLYLFSLLGTTNKKFVEFGVNDGRECLTANLSVNFGWSGLLIEGDPEAFNRAKIFYRSLLPGSASDRIKIVNNLVTAENINALLQDNGVTGEIDFLSIDIDGNDYWVWKAINAINPRVVVIEYNGILGNDRPLTVRYQPDFMRFKMHPAGYYYGTSLPAAAKLAETKGYVFVGCESTGGVNAFFVRRDVAQGKIEPVTTLQGFYPQQRRTKNQSMDELFQTIKHLPFEEV